MRRWCPKLSKTWSSLTVITLRDGLSECCAPCYFKNDKTYPELVESSGEHFWTIFNFTTEGAPSTLNLTIGFPPSWSLNAFISNVTYLRNCLRIQISMENTMWVSNEGCTFSRNTFALKRDFYPKGQPEWTSEESAAHQIAISRGRAGWSARVTQWWSRRHHDHIAHGPLEYVTNV